MDYTRRAARSGRDAETARISNGVEHGFLFEAFSGPPPNVPRIQIQAGVAIDHRINCVPNPVFTNLPIRCFSVCNVAALFLGVLAIPGLYNNRLNPRQTCQKEMLS